MIDTRHSTAWPHVRMPDPASVYIDPALPADAIAPGVTIHPGCRLLGPQTRIGPGSTIGLEGPATIENTAIGHDVKFGGGYVSGSVILDNVTFGGNAHLRPGCLIEEAATCGHAVGLKQSILMPFCALGSLINFCDVLLAGGTGARHHSEVGSSYVHFNFTPRGDKATPSLFGDVPHGVMLDQPPIFLGGQGGVVGPARVAFGTVAAAGTILRGDRTERSQLISGPSPVSLQPYDPARTGNPTRKLQNNLLYLANLHALHHWYRFVRPRFTAPDPYREACRQGGLAMLTLAVTERITRLEQWAGILIADGPADFHPDLPHLRNRLMLETHNDTAHALRTAFLEKLPDPQTPHYPDWIQSWPPTLRQAGSLWLQTLVDDVLASCQQGAQTPS